VCAHREHLHAKFVTGDPWIGEKRHLAEVTGDVRTTNTDAMNPDQRLSRIGSGRFSDINAPEALRLFELDGFHKNDNRDLCEPPETGKG
jgi:hypothetical protein